MPFGLWPVNEGLGQRFRHEKRWLAAPGAVSSLSWTPSTTQEYGLSAARHELKLNSLAARKSAYLRGYLNDPRFEKLGHFRLTRLQAEAYIPAIGAPPASCWHDDAPLKLLTGTVKRHPIVIGCLASLTALRATGERGSPDSRAV